MLLKRKYIRLTRKKISSVLHCSECMAYNFLCTADLVFENKCIKINGKLGGLYKYVFTKKKDIPKFGYDTCKTYELEYIE